jgi:predicted dehydrogenase
MDGASISRRSFLDRGGQIIGAALAAPIVVREGALAAPGRPGPNDRVPIGFIGAGGRARLLMKQMPKEGEIVAVCDCFLPRAHEAMKERSGGAEWEVFQDYRKLLDRKDIPAVVVPTHDHGRVLTCIHACQAGKDIYAEKPLTLTIKEGRALVNAVRKHKRVFQVGSQQRSMEWNRYICEMVRTGRFGKLKAVLAINYSGPGLCDGFPEQKVPEGLDWDMWLNQTKFRPYNGQLHGGWMGCRSFSGGEMTNWGAHGVDQVQWALGADTSGPVEGWPETEGPNGKVTFRYASGVLLKFENGGSGDLGTSSGLGGAAFECEKGTVKVDRNWFKAPEDLVQDKPEQQKADMWEGPGWQAKFHIGNWLDCMKTRKLPVADVEIGHRSISVCHLANIVRQVGRKLRWDPETEIFPGDDEANAHLERPRRKGYEIPDPL